MACDWSIKATDVAIVLSTIAGPILAVWASEIRQRRRALLEKKEWIFHTLWATKSSPLRLEHVQALTLIEPTFHVSAPSVLDEWYIYLKHLRTPQGESEAEKSAWHQKSEELLRNILKAIAEHLKIPLTKLQLNEKSYYPDGYVLNEIRQQEIQKLFLELLENRRTLSVDIKP